MKPDRHVRWRNTALWRTIAQELLRLQADGHVHFGEEGDSRAIATGELCAGLDFDGHATGTRLAFVRAAFETTGPDILVAAVDDMKSLPFEVCALIENDRDEREIASHIAKYESETAEIDERPMTEFLPLTRALMRAYERGGG